jgi:hypothetical protein
VVADHQGGEHQGGIKRRVAHISEREKARLGEVRLAEERLTEVRVARPAMLDRALPALRHGRCGRRTVGAIEIRGIVTDLTNDERASHRSMASSVYRWK